MAGGKGGKGGWAQRQPEAPHGESGAELGSLERSMLGEGEGAAKAVAVGVAGRTESGVLRPRRSQLPLRRTLSDPTGLARRAGALGIGGGGGGGPSPFQDALHVRHARRRRKGALKHMGRSLHRTKKKGEITQEHEQYSITYCMMLGIRFSVSRQSPAKAEGSDLPEGNAGGRRRLTIDDFMHVDRLVFDPAGSTRTPAHQLGERFKFKDYAPEVFRQLRVKFGIDDMDYMLSLCGKYNYIEFISNSKSGQFFFYSNDGHYLIKTQSKAESKFLRQILAQYYMYMMEHDDSLLVRICGMHRVRLAHLGRNMHFVILKSVYSNAATRKIHTVYDLKGSTVGRSARAGEAVFKDMDLVKNAQTFKLGPLRDEFLAQVRKDAEFLARLHIMDYSLLVGIHNKVAPSIAKSVDLLTGQSSRNLGGMQHTGGRGSTKPDRPSSPRARIGNNIRHRRSHTMPRLLGQVEDGSEHERNMTNALNGGRHFGNAQSCTSGHSGSATAASASEGRRVRPYELEDADLYYYQHEQHEQHDSDEELEEPLPADSKFSPVESMDEEGRPGTEIYYFGIIDILQQYNTRKRAENVLKSAVEGGEKGISSVNPRKYAARFVRFVRDHIDNS